MNHSSINKLDKRLAQHRYLIKAMFNDRVSDFYRKQKATFDALLVVTHL